jgi:DNA polymerase elongation subunit (family B)
MNSELRDILFLDIETVGCVDCYDNLHDRLKTQWARKASFLRREEGQTDEDLFNNRAGIYAEFGKTIVVAVGKYFENEKGELGLKTKYFADHDEKKLLLDFKAMLDKMDPATTRLCAHNGKEFDFPYLCRRLLVNGVALPLILNQSGRKPWEVTHLDTMEMWKFGDYKHYTSLDLLAAIFDIPSSKGVMDGSMVNQVYYKDKELSKIAEYCLGDVIAIAQLYLKFKGMDIIPDGNIQHTS